MALPGFKATAVDGSGNTLGATSVEVRLQSDNSLATLYSDKDATTPIANPFNAAANGDFEFYTASGAYSVSLGAGASPQIFPIDIVNADTMPKNPYDFGAIGDGVSDDTTSLQATIDYVSSLGGGTISSQSGVFLCKNVEMKSNVLLTDLRLKSAVASSSGEFCIGFSSSVSGASLDRVFIDGNKLSQTQDMDAISLNGVRNSVRNCEIFDTSGTGVSIVAGAEQCDVTDNKIHDADGNGVRHEYHASNISSHCSLSGNIIEDTGEVAITLISGSVSTPSAGVSHFRISGNVVRRTGLNGTAGGIGGYSPNNRHVLFEGNVIEDANNHGIHAGGDYITINGNTFKDTTNSSVFVRNWPNNSGTSVCSHVSVSGNTIDTAETDTNGEGIIVENCHHFSISGNEVSNTVNAGIAVLGETLGASFRSMHGAVTGNSITAVSAGGTTSNESGILVENSDGITITGNAVDASEDANINIRGCTDTVITANTCANSVSSHGILIIDGTGTTETSEIVCTGNICIDNNSFGIQVSDSPERTIISDNICRGNGSGQMNVTGVGSGSLVNGNIGRRTRNAGTASVADGGIISHFMGVTPTSYTVTPTVANRIVAVSAVTSSNMTIQLSDASGTPIAVAETVSWTTSAEVT
ncbi:MAG: putative right handed beta helix region protein [Prokaryotic dsDNA virus sp.]|jgi:hypothetical protein|nr:MAG: putative right handed beta helix region protein [Prokaryotic dsDNA virus sp.]|tara:strand:- start:2753 stop:4675 length:1923 start_codon:yes stop_codon:yes gene_type:complete